MCHMMFVFVIFRKERAASFETVLAYSSDLTYSGSLMTSDSNSTLTGSIWKDETDRPILPLA